MTDQIRPQPGIMEIELYVGGASKVEGMGEVTKLSSNENPYGAGEAAREALERAERAMRGAEESLRENDLAGAIDRQSDAMEALREGLRNMGEAMAEEQRQRAGQQGEAEGNTGGERNDPLGRTAGTNGEMGSQQDMLQDRDVYRRALELEEELRRRSGEGERPELEREYLKRLLERF